jgi:hypothetical protein
VLISACRTITKTDPADGYWGVDASFRYGSTSVILDTTAGALDTGTSLIYIATGKNNSDAYQILVLTHITYFRRL